MPYAIYLWNALVLGLSVGVLMFFSLMFIWSVMDTLPRNNQQ